MKSNVAASCRGGVTLNKLGQGRNLGPFLIRTL